MQFTNGYIIFSDAFMNTIRILFLVFILISVYYTIMVTFFMKNVFDFAKKDNLERYIPFYNVFKLLEILKTPTFFGLLQFIPLGNIFYIYMINSKLCDYFDKKSDYIWKLTFLPFIYMPLLTKEKDKNKRVTEKKTEEKKVEKYSMKSFDTNLLTDKELENLNKTKIEEEEIDSIFKADIDLIEPAKPYKAGRQKVKVIDEEPTYERETIKRVEAVKARDIRREGKFIKEEDIIEKIDL